MPPPVYFLTSKQLGKIPGFIANRELSDYEKKAFMMSPLRCYSQSPSTNRGQLSSVFEVNRIFLRLYLKVEAANERVKNQR
jgi:hypothetical protein